MYVEAVYTLPPSGISMLSVQSIPPVLGRFHLSPGWSACSWTMSPDHAKHAQMSPLASSGA